MIFSNLEEAIAGNKLSQREKTKYLVFAVLICFIAYPFELGMQTLGKQHDNTSVDLTTMLGSAANMIVAFLGIKRCYRTNEAIDDSNFIERFILLNFPMTIKFVLLMFLLILAYIVMTWALKSHYPAVWERIPTYLSVLVILITYFYYVFLNRSFVRLGAKIGE
ncbi:MAG: hypothetical protein NT105_13595 [Verrucomicrobia bacterium]|nr:hypothetical protein [Verrucomicrobiota bacterium]